MSENDHTFETYKSMISISIEGIKSLVLLNGGAIIAMIGYLGQITNRAQQASKASCPLACFVFGLSLACLCFFGSYFTQFALFNESNNRKPSQSHMKFFIITSICAIASLIAFSVGAFWSIKVFASA